MSTGNTGQTAQSALRSAPKKVALIGLGGISQSVHLPLITRLHDEVELAAVVDLSAERRQSIVASYGAAVPHFQSVEELIAGCRRGLLLDGAVLATTGSHAEDTKKLLTAGIPVLSEKPLAYSLAEHEDLERHAAGLGIGLRDALLIGYMKEHDPASRAARELLSGVRIRAVEVEVLHPADDAQLAFANLRGPASDIPEEALRNVAQPTREALDRAVGARVFAESQGDMDRLYPNVVLGSVIHDIALLRYLVGGIGTVNCAQHYGPEFPGSLFLRGALRDHSAPWTINWHFIADYPQYQETITIHHEEGSIDLIFDVPYLLNAPTRLVQVAGLPGLGVQRSTRQWPQAEAFEEEWRAFVDLMEGRESAGSSGRESAMDIRVGQEMIRLLAQSKGIQLDPSAEAALL